MHTRGCKPVALLSYVLLVGTLLLAACTPDIPQEQNGLSVPQTAGTEPSTLVTDTLSPTAAAATPTEGIPPTEAVSPNDEASPSVEFLPMIEASPTMTVENVTSFPDPNNFTWAPVVTGLRQPTDLQPPMDGSGRLMVLEQPGTIRVLQGATLLPEPFLDLQDRVGARGSEQGLLGLAFHPDYAQNGFFYVNYTDQNGDTVIARFSVSPDDANRADPGSEAILLRVDQPYGNHNGGGMVFGPDGYLYMSLGDGGSANDPQGNAQSLNTHLGKLLRVDVDGGEPYVIPADNPFAGGGGLPEIWAYGLRNPWRFSFDRATGDLYIADVGQNQWEEINYWAAGSPAGVNYGWDFREGAHPFEGTPPDGLTLVDPVAEYQHSAGCSVTGGYVYRGQALPQFQGIYLYSDYCSGRVWGLLRAADGAWQSQELFRTGLNVSAFGQDEAGEIYLVDQGTGGIYRLQAQ